MGDGVAPGCYSWVQLLQYIELLMVIQRIGFVLNLLVSLCDRKQCRN